MAAWATAIAASIFLGALSGAYAAEKKPIQPPPGFLTAEQTMAEFKNIGRNSELALPDGVAWPQTPPADLSDTEGAFEIGYIKSVSNLYWLCAWEETLVNATAARNVQRGNEGRAAIASFAKSEWFAQNDVDPDNSWRTAVLDPALDGDLSGVNADLATCGYFHENQ